MNNLKKVTIVALLFVYTAGLLAQQVPIDPKVRYGKLENGLTYYIRQNQKPKDRAEFYIAQNVGAILENDDQNGLAHFLEHMAFNGTKHYPGKDLINYFESIGVKFGANINAYTALDETVYNLSNVPVVRKGVIDSALLVLHDWSGYILLEDHEVDEERGVILEEWRTGAGADRRMWKEANKLKYPGSQYAKRDVIGDTAVINNFSYQVLRDFYNKWYRPDLQAILVVGDIDVDEIEQKIKARFSTIPAKANAGERPVYEVFNNEKPIVAAVKDPEARFTRVMLEYKHDKKPVELHTSINGYVLTIVNNLISGMINERIGEITQQADAPFVAGFGGYGELVKSKDAFRLIAIPNEGRESEGLSALLLEAEKIQRYGFTNSELERAKTALMKRIEMAYNERDNQENNNLIEEYVRHFLSHEVIPGIEWEYNTLQLALPQLTIDMVSQVAKSYVTDENLIVSFQYPEKEGVKIPQDDKVLVLIENAKSAELEAKAEEDLNKPLLNVIPKAGKIKKVTTNKSLGTTEWLLGNGVKVVFKPTDYKQDEIIMSAYSEGGLSKVVSPDDLVSASLAATIVANNGLGEFSQVELGKLLSGKIASVSPSIGNYSEGFSGKSSVADFETMMQLLYLNITSIRKDDNAFGALINMYRASLANSGSDPRKAFSDSVGFFLANRHPRAVILNLEAIDKIDQDKALAIYKERFAAPSDFTFFFTGNVNPDAPEVKNAVLRYLGGLKTKKVSEKYTDNKIRKPQGIANNYFTKEMQIKKASNCIVYSGQMPFNMDNRTAMTAIGSILSIRYLESIREKEGGSYGVGVRGSLSRIPVEEATLLMQFDTDPEKQSRLMSIIHQEVNEIVENGPRADDLQKVKENMFKQLEEDLRENNWWHFAVENHYVGKQNFVEDYKKSVERLSVDVIRETLKQLKEQGNVIEVVMTPAE